MAVLDYHKLQQMLVLFDPNGGDSDEENFSYFQQMFGDHPEERTNFVKLFSAMMQDTSRTPLDKFQQVVGRGPANDEQAIAALKDIFMVVTGDPWIGD